MEETCGGPKGAGGKAKRAGGVMFSDSASPDAAKGPKEMSPSGAKLLKRKPTPFSSALQDQIKSSGLAQWIASGKPAMKEDAEAETETETVTETKTAAAAEKQAEKEVEKKTDMKLAEKETDGKAAADAKRATAKAAEEAVKSVADAAGEATKKE